MMIEHKADDEVRMKNWAEESAEAQVFSRLGEMYLDKGNLIESLRYYTKARNYANYQQIYKLMSSDNSFRK